MLDSSGNVITSANPSGETGAGIVATVGSGTYYVRVSPVGSGSPQSNPPSGYTTYGSLGAYTISGTFTGTISPTITTQPTNQSATFGGEVTLIVNATGSSPMTYQWKLNGVIIPGATSSSYTIDSAEPIHAGRYTVTVSNESESVTSTPAYLHFPGLLWAAGDNSNGEFGGDYPITQLHRVANGVVDAAAGSEFSAYVRSNGELWAMGRRVRSGSFGDSVDHAPRARLLATDVAKVAGDHDNLFYLKTDGTLLVSGRDNYGELGLGGSPSPLFQNAQVATDVADMQVRGGFAVYLKTNGELWASGLNTSGQLGDGTTQARVNFSLMATGVESVATGGIHTLFIKTDGTLWGVGNNTSGQLGNATFANQLTPIQMASGVVACAAGAKHSLYITTTGELWGTGANESGQLGNATTENRNTAVLISTNVSRVAAGYSTTFFIKTDGSMWAAGRNDYGQLGNGETEKLLGPAQIMMDVAMVSANDTHTLFVKTDGSLWTVGHNNYGQLGNGVTTYRPDPILMDADVVDVSGGSAHTLYLKADGTIWGVGRNSNSQLGITNSTYVANPIQIASDVTTLSASYTHSLYVTADGTLWGMGSNHYGPLGLGHTDEVNEPTSIAEDVVAVATSPGHSLFLKRDETLWAMGYNAWGQLGDGTQIQRVTPVEIATDVNMMVAGDYHSLFVKTDGTLWAMGRNNAGQLGDGTTNDVATPVQVSNDVVQVAVAGLRTLFLKTDGTLWGMGAGVSDNDQELHPVLMAEDVVSYAVGSSYYFIMHSDGRLDYKGTTSRGESGLGDIYLFDQATGTIEAGILKMRASNNKTFFIQSEQPSGALPVITKQPTGGIFPEGANVSLTVEATEDWPFTGVDYQWRKDGVAISGARNAIFYLPSIQAAHAGSYDVVITNAAGSVTSDMIAVTLDASPTAASVSIYAPNREYNGQPQGVTIVETDPYGLSVSVTYDGSTDRPVEVGTYNVVATITESGYSGSASGTFTITKASQSISFTGIDSRPYSEIPIMLAATSSSGLTVTYLVVSGPATISGDQLTLTGTGTVVVRASQAGNTNYLAAANVDRAFEVTTSAQSWITTHFTESELDDEAISGPTADPDGDGLTNLLEYALGLDPRSPDTTGLPEMSTTETDWVYTYTRPVDRDDITYAVEISSDLSGWSTTGITHELVSTDGGTQTWRATVPLSSATSLYFHLKISQN